MLEKYLERNLGPEHVMTGPSHDIFHGGKLGVTTVMKNSTLFIIDVQFFD